MMKFQAASPKCRSRSLFQVICCLLYLMVSHIFKWDSLDLECCSKAKLYNFDLNCWCQKNSFYLITRHQILFRFILECINNLFTTKAKLKRKVSKKMHTYDLYNIFKKININIIILLYYFIKILFCRDEQPVHVPLRPMQSR